MESGQSSNNNTRPSCRSGSSVCSRDAEGEVIRRAKGDRHDSRAPADEKALLEGSLRCGTRRRGGCGQRARGIAGCFPSAACTSVLLGDFMQLGAIVDKQRTERISVLISSGGSSGTYSRTCGIATPDQAEPTCRLHGAGCTAQIRSRDHGTGEQSRVRRTRCKPGPSVRAHAPGDPEIVLIDTDGLGDLGQVRAAGPSKGWWPAGALLSRVRRRFPPCPRRTHGRRHALRPPGGGHP